MKPSVAISLVILFSSASLSGIGALAQNKPATTPMATPAKHAVNQSPCTVDFDRFCRAVPPGQGRKIQCLEDHKLKLMPECRARLDGVLEIEQSLAAKNHESLDEWRQKSYAEHEHADYVRKIRAKSQAQQPPSTAPSSAPAKTPPAQQQQPQKPTKTN